MLGTLVHLYSGGSVAVQMSGPKPATESPRAVHRAATAAGQKVKETQSSAAYHTNTWAKSLQQRCSSQVKWENHQCSPGDGCTARECPVRETQHCSAMLRKY